MTTVDDVGLLCLAIDSGENHEIIGRTKLQKMIYFCQYLGWDVSDYKLHYYGPFSFGLADTVKTAESSEFIRQGNTPPYTFSLTDDGDEFLNKFETRVCDPAKLADTREFIQYLSDWTKEELELAATLDFVNQSNLGITRVNLISKVGVIKENFTQEDITNAFHKLRELKASL